MEEGVDTGWGTLFGDDTTFDSWDFTSIPISTSTTPQSDLDQALIDYAEKSGTDLATAQKRFEASGLTLGDLSGTPSFNKLLQSMFTTEGGKPNAAGILGLTAFLNSSLGKKLLGNVILILNRYRRIHRHIVNQIVVICLCRKL